MRRISQFLFLLFIVLLSSGACAEKKSGFIWLGGAGIDVDGKVVALPVELVNLSGGLEFILSFGKTKDYESLLSSTVNGNMLHLALVSVGFEASAFNEKSAYEDQLKEQASAGSRLEVSIQFEGSGERKPLSECLLWASGNSLKENRWYFAGSYFRLDEEGKKFYAANGTLCLIASYPTTSMVIGPDFPVENPYGDGAVSFLTPNKKNLPAVGAKAMMYITASGKTAASGNAAAIDKYAMSGNNIGAGK